MSKKTKKKLKKAFRHAVKAEKTFIRTNKIIKQISGKKKKVHPLKLAGIGVAAAAAVSAAVGGSIVLLVRIGEYEGDDGDTLDLPHHRRSRTAFLNGSLNGNFPKKPQAKRQNLN